VATNSAGFANENTPSTTIAIGTTSSAAQVLLSYLYIQANSSRKVLKPKLNLLAIFSNLSSEVFFNYVALSFSN
jgi:hypothetical protein